MNYKIVNGAISYGADTILEEINFEIKDKEKIAIVGRNGSGKTSFLKALIDNEMLEEGIGENKFNIYKQGINEIGYLKQIDFEDDSTTMLDEILKVYKPIIQLEQKINKLENKLQESSSQELIQDYTESLEKYEFFGGYTYKKEYETAIKKFGFTKEDESKKISQFSGGQRTKIAFLKLILSKPDILLLDEPTNHMDIIGKESLDDDENNIIKTTPKEKNTNNQYFIDKQNNKLKNKMNKIEQEIENKENKIKELEKEILDENISTDYIKLAQLQEEIQKLKNEIEEKMIEWENLSEKLVD